MIKKIIGLITTVVFVGTPLLVFAGCNIAGGDTPFMCGSIGGVWTPDGPVSGAGTVGGASQVSGASTVGGGTQNQGQGTSFGVDPNAPKLQNPIKFNTFSELVAQITKTAVEILLPFVVLAFIWSGFLFVRAQGNQTELDNAKRNIWYSIVGAFILMGAWGFATMISQTVQTLTN